MGLESAYHGFRVIIVGGGLGGLTLANALERADIDYVLLEARADICPQLGASIGIFPHGARILDQLGCWEDLKNASYGIQWAGNHHASGQLISPKSDGPQLGLRRTGYAPTFLERQFVLQVLHKYVQDKSKIMTSTRVSSVDHTAKGVTVNCADGTSHEGDIVVGADGIFSSARKEMWNAADREEPGFITEEEKQKMTAEYQILYGMSTATPGLVAGHYDITHMKDISSMFIVGKNDTVYWFLFKRMDKVYKSGEIPRYTKGEAEAFAKLHLDINLEPNVKFQDVWKNRKFYTLAATEEADYEKWTWGRFVCLGDSVHKATPNAGIGGNAAIESAAALANTIKKMLDASTSRPSLDTVKRSLEEYQTSRYQRMSDSLKLANTVTRIQALKGLVERIAVFYVFPYVEDILSDLNWDMIIGASKIDICQLLSGR